MRSTFSSSSRPSCDSPVPSLENFDFSAFFKHFSLDSSVARYLAELDVAALLDNVGIAATPLARLPAQSRAAALHARRTVPDELARLDSAFAAVGRRGLDVRALRADFAEARARIAQCEREEAAAWAAAQRPRPVPVQAEIIMPLPPRPDSPASFDSSSSGSSFHSSSYSSTSSASSYSSAESGMSKRSSRRISTSQLAPDTLAYLRQAVGDPYQAASPDDRYYQQSRRRTSSASSSGALPRAPLPEPVAVRARPVISTSLPAPVAVRPHPSSPRSPIPRPSRAARNF